MSGEFTNERFPKSALYAAGALIAISILTVGSIRLGVLPAPETAPQSRERRQVAEPKITPLQNDPQQNQRETKPHTFRVSCGHNLRPDSD